jgi:hypothetical protein
MSAVDARKRWARRLMTAPGGPVPAYGTAEWLALPEGDPAKVAAVVRAAECWACDADDLEARLRLEVETMSLAHKRAEDDAYAARRDAHRAEWQRLPGDATRPLATARRMRLLEGGEAS